MILSAVLLSVVLSGPAQAAVSATGHAPKRGPGIEQLQPGTYLAQVKAFSSVLTLSGPRFRSFTPEKLVQFIHDRMAQPEATLAEIAAGSTLLTALADPAAGAQIVAKLAGMPDGKPASDSLAALVGRFSGGKTAEAAAKLDFTLPASADALFDGLALQDAPLIIPEPALQGLLLLAKDGRSRVGSRVIVKMGGRKLIGVFLGSSRDKSGRAVSYFFDTTTHDVVWTYSKEIHWDETFEPEPIEVRKQEGPACFANALANCVDYLADINHAVKPSWSRAAKGQMLSDAVKVMEVLREKHPYGMTGSHKQDRYALRLLRKLGLGGRLAGTRGELRAHLDKGLPALLGLRVKKASTRDTSLWSEDGIFRDTPHGWLERFVPSPEKPGRTVERHGEFVFVTEHKSLHEVVALGRIKAEDGFFIIVADSKTGEIAAWPEDDVLDALEGGQILAGAEPQSLLVAYLRQHGILR